MNLFIVYGYIAIAPIIIYRELRKQLVHILHISVSYFFLYLMNEYAQNITTVAIFNHMTPLKIFAIALYATRLYLHLGYGS